jgi:hypothetical protein
MIMFRSVMISGILARLTRKPSALEPMKFTI